MKISEITRRDVIESVAKEGFDWYGRLEELDFLSRIFDLESLPSTDGRFKDAAGDIWQHRVNNYDWEDDWLFRDDRLGLMNGPDDVFLKFLCEFIHPVVRPDAIEVDVLLNLFNEILKNDGFRLIEKERISGKRVFAGEFFGVSVAPAVGTAKDVFLGMDETYVGRQISRMESAVENDPDLAIGTAKELVESCCRSILQVRGIEAPKKIELPKLVKLTTKELRLTPDDIPKEAKASETIKRLLSNLATITHGIAELRNDYGTGHGKGGDTRGLQPRHAKLAVGAASTLAVFLTETHRLR